jgi:predicted DNA-binding ribbon-helix-helix protein
MPITTAALIHSIASKRVEGNLSSALRVDVLEHFRARQKGNVGMKRGAAVPKD